MADAWARRGDTDEELPFDTDEESLKAIYAANNVPGYDGGIIKKRYESKRHGLSRVPPTDQADLYPRLRRLLLRVWQLII
jgi:hypothetical protein